MAITQLDLSNGTSLSLTGWAEKTNELINFVNIVAANSTIDGRLASMNAYVTSTFAKNSYVTSTFASNTYVNSVPFASSLFTKILNLDGPGSTLDADTVDGKHANFFLANATYTATDVLNKIKTVDGTGSGLDADLLDGRDSTYFLPAENYTATDVLNKIKTVDGTGSGLDAELLAGQNAAFYRNPNNLTSNVPFSKLDPSMRPVATAIDSSSDWNTILTPGWYSSLLGTANANSPSAGNYFWCLVVDYGGATQTQIAIPYIADSEQIYIRTRYNNAWRVWKKIPYTDQVALLSGATFTGPITGTSATFSGTLTMNGGANVTGALSVTHSNYAVSGRSTNTGLGGVVGYTTNTTYYGILGHANAYSFYGVGNARVDSGVWMAGYNGAAGSPAYTFATQTSTGMYFGSSLLRFSVGGNEILQLAGSSAGVLGTFSTANYIVNSGGTYYGSSSFAALTVNNTSGTIYLRPRNDTVAQTVIDNSGNLTTYNHLISGSGYIVSTVMGWSTAATLYFRPQGYSNGNYQTTLDSVGRWTITGNGASTGYGVTVFGPGSGGAVLGYAPNTAYYGILGYAGNYSFYGSGTIYTTGDIIAFSDRSVKFNLEIIDNALWKMTQLNGYTFNRSDLVDQRDRRFTGVIAQEVEEVLPEAVTENAEGLKAVAYGNMVGLTIEAIKELNKKLEDENRQLKERLAIIEAKLGI